MSAHEAALRAVVKKFLADNDTEGFGCACTPTSQCGPCQWETRTRPLRAALASTATAAPDETPDDETGCLACVTCGAPNDESVTKAAEPVAWLWTGHTGNVQAFVTKPPPSMLADPKCQPLYAPSPQTPAETQAKPAWQGKVVEVWNESHGGGYVRFSAAEMPDIGATLYASPPQTLQDYESAFMDGLSWMEANRGSKPSEWRQAAKDCAAMRQEPKT